MCCMTALQTRICSIAENCRMNRFTDKCLCMPVAYGRNFYFKWDLEHMEMCLDGSLLSQVQRIFRRTGQNAVCRDGNILIGNNGINVAAFADLSTLH